MRTHRAHAFLIAAILASGCTHLQQSTSASESMNAARQVLLNSIEAYAHGDYPGVEALWAHGEEASVFESGEANYGWADYRDRHLKPELAEMKNVEYRLNDVVMRGDAKTAWSTFKWSFSADYHGRHLSASGLGTAVLEQGDSGWKIVHWHTSSPR